MAEVAGPERPGHQVRSDVLPGSVRGNSHLDQLLSKNAVLGVDFYAVSNPFSVKVG